VICVNYRSSDAAIEFVGDLLAQDTIDRLEIVVVDNSASETAGLRLPYQHPNVRILTPSSNLGYFGGADFGVQQLGAHPEWLAVSNPDVRMPGRRFFSDLFSNHPSGAAAVVSPQIVSADGLDQNPFMPRRPSSVRMHLYKWLFRYHQSTLAYEILSAQKQRLRTLLGHGRNHRDLSTSELKPRRIYAPHGSFILFHRSYFEGGGTLRYGTFLFGEEFFVAETARRLGLDVVYDPRLRLIHQGRVSRGVLPDRKMSRHIREASKHLADTYF
jgi:GT2 family glycosyltransferase